MKEFYDKTWPRPFLSCMLRWRPLFSQTEQKNLLDDDAFDVSYVFFS